MWSLSFPCLQDLLGTVPMPSFCPILALQCSRKSIPTSRGMSGFAALWERGDTMGISSFILPMIFKPGFLSLLLGPCHIQSLAESSNLCTTLIPPLLDLFYPVKSPSSNLPGTVVQNSLWDRSLLQCPTPICHPGYLSCWCWAALATSLQPTSGGPTPYPA